MEIHTVFSCAYGDGTWTVTFWNRLWHVGVVKNYWTVTGTHCIYSCTPEFHQTRESKASAIFTDAMQKYSVMDDTGNFQKLEKEYGTWCTPQLYHSYDLFKARLHLNTLWMHNTQN